jgi:UDP-N-acetylmuramoyl-tripeptide--D-alanyl-D-alanine ligase
MSIDRLLHHFLQHRLVTTDTRKIQPHSIFFSLKGANFNGNAFALQALEEGCDLAVVDEPIAVNDPRLVHVPDVLLALQSLAFAYRNQFNVPVLAITGSNGKTTTKELLRDVLAKKYNVHATLGNLNNHIGIPLTLLSMPTDTDLAIIEMGANHQREIASYCQFTKPTHGLITNIGKAHLEGFGGIEGVKKGKKELYDFLEQSGGVIFANTDEPELREITAGLSIIGYGLRQPAWQLMVESETPSLTLSWIEANEIHTIATHLAGAYNAHNIAAAIAVGLHFKVAPEDIVSAIEAYIPDNNRSQLMHTGKNTLIMDAYNANPSSMEHALINLSRQQEANKQFIIGDMRELGQEATAEHKRILVLAAELGLKGLLVGPLFQTVSDSGTFLSFATTEDAAAYLRHHPVSDNLVLVKGSRGMKLEQLVPFL